MNEKERLKRIIELRQQHIKLSKEDIKRAISLKNLRIEESREVIRECRIKLWKMD